VQEVSLEVNVGEIVGLLGPNGAGKTTTSYIVVGLIRPDAGTVYLDGRVLTPLPMHKRARLGIGYLPQKPSIFRKMTVEENILAILETLPWRRSKRRGPGVVTSEKRPGTPHGHVGRSSKREWSGLGSPWNMPMMRDSWGIVMMLMMLVFWAAIVVVIIVGVRWLMTSSRSGRQATAERQTESALDVLKKRYARGEISKEAFEDMRRDIE
jgi:ABC-type Fe3+/spermidine/putrescine transport system ATPase subunit